MKKYLKDILEDVYMSDPSLKDRERELVRIIESLVERRPEAAMREEFREDLRRKILAAAGEARAVSRAEKWIGSRHVPAFAGVMVLVLLIAGTWYFGGGSSAPVASRKSSNMASEKEMRAGDALEMAPSRTGGGMEPPMMMALEAPPDGGGAECAVPEPGDFPAGEAYDGPPAAVDFGPAPGSDMFRTRILDGVSSGANFAGHYRLISWGCGTACQEHAIVDLVTGEITEFGIPSNSGIEFSLDSRLVVVNPLESIPLPGQDAGPLLDAETRYYVLGGEGVLEFLCSERWESLR